MKIVIVFLIITHPEKRSIFVERTNLSWLKCIQELLCQEYVLETNFKNILLKKAKKLLCFSSEKGKKYFAKKRKKRERERNITDRRKF